jgi:hypothetical protein
MNHIRRRNRIPNLAFMTNGMVEDREERLTFRTVFPVRLAAAHIPHLPKLGEVEVLL